MSTHATPQVLIDTSRHFLSVVVLENILDSFAASKINVMHWHIVDTQSFPFGLPSHPEMAKMGAYSSQERFSPLDVAHVVEYARQRGIRVMVEIDTPGHAGSWCAAHPEVCPSPSCLQPLNVAQDATFTLISEIFADVTGKVRGAGLFPDNMMHLGGDEVS